MQEPLDNEEEQLDPRTENELKKIKLSLEHGMDFSNVNMDADLPPEVESEFLDHLKQWEEQFALQKKIVIYERMGRPVYIPLQDLADDQLVAELERVIDLLKKCSIYIESLCDIDDREMYRFITEELFLQEIDDIRVEGMMHCFTYEDFHQNHEYDINRRCDEFVEFVTDKREGTPDTWCLVDNITVGERTFTKEEFSNKLIPFRDSFSAFTLHRFELVSIELNEEKNDAKAIYNIHYTGDMEGSAETQDFEGTCTLWLMRKEEWWMVYKCEMPGVTA